LASQAIKFGKKNANKGYYAVQGHSRSSMFVQSKAHMQLPISD